MAEDDGPDGHRIHIAGCAALLIEAGKVATVNELADRLTTSSVELTRGDRTSPRSE